MLVIFLNNYNDARNNECKIYNELCGVVKMGEKIWINIGDKIGSYLRKKKYLIYYPGDMQMKT